MMTKHGQLHQQITILGCPVTQAGGKAQKSGSPQKQQLQPNVPPAPSKAPYPLQLTISGSGMASRLTVPSYL